MEEPRIVENSDTQITIYYTPKRKVGIRVCPERITGCHWRVSYEDGKPIEGLSEGVFTSRKRALDAIRLWEITAKRSPTKKQLDLFGDKEPPVLKRKQKRAARD